MEIIVFVSIAFIVMSFFGLSFLDFFQEPWVIIVLASVSWFATLVIWVVSPEYVLIPLVISILLTIFAIVLFFIETGTDSSAKIDKATGRHRCRVCHSYFPPDQLKDKTCPNCRQTLRS
ncbi:MAG: hypothetical protein ACXAB4_04680 [Candidatus Hodarchaeales archaeon]